MATELTETTYDNTISQTEGLALVQFTAPWCGPCRMLAPRLQELENEGAFTYYKVDVDSESELARTFQIMSVPTIIVYRDGKQVNRFVGAKSKKDLISEIAF